MFLRNLSIFTSVFLASHLIAARLLECEPMLHERNRTGHQNRQGMIPSMDQTTAAALLHRVKRAMLVELIQSPMILPKNVVCMLKKLPTKCILRADCLQHARNTSLQNIPWRKRHILSLYLCFHSPSEAHHCEAFGAQRNPWGFLPLLRKEGVTPPASNPVGLLVGSIKRPSSRRRLRR